MRSYKREITKAIKAAGLDLNDFEIRRDEVEIAYSGEVAEEDVEEGNAKLELVSEELQKLGLTVGGYRCGWGGWVIQVNQWRHPAHDLDYNDRASIWHY